MRISQLIAKIRKNGGRVWIDPLGRLNAEAVSEIDMSELADSRDLVMTILREEIASKRSASSENPTWWRVPEEAWNFPEQTLKSRSELVRIWAKTRCVVSMRCSSKASALHCDFVGWLGLGSDAVAEQEFLLPLASLGWHLTGGWVQSLCLAEDFAVAFWRLNRGCSLSDRTELHDQAETRGNSAQPENGQELARAARAGKNAI